MPDPCVPQSWCARNGRESSRRECYGKSSLREWYAQTRSGRGSQRGGVGKYLNSLLQCSPLQIPSQWALPKSKFIVSGYCWAPCLCWDWRPKLSAPLSALALSLSFCAPMSVTIFSWLSMCKFGIPVLQGELTIPSSLKKHLQGFFSSEVFPIQLGFFSLKM